MLFLKNFNLSSVFEDTYLFYAIYINASKTIKVSYLQTGHVVGEKCNLDSQQPLLLLQGKTRVEIRYKKISNFRKLQQRKY